MIQFSTTILQFEEQGEKTGWTYILIPSVIAQQLQPGSKKSFRVKGFLDESPIEGISLLPMGSGDFIMALNADIRKKIKKRKGAKLAVRLLADNRPVEAPAGFMESLQDEPEALAFFNSLTGSHRNYFLKWISSAKTEQTRVKRITQAVTAFCNRMGYPEMIRANRK